MSNTRRILFFGDVVGTPGIDGLKSALPQLRDELKVDFVIVNGENSAGGRGVTEKSATKIFNLGVDAITNGNHTYSHRDVYPYLDSEPRIVRPANFPIGNPGRGSTVVERDGVRLGVINLSGQFALHAARSPLVEIEALLPKLKAKCDLILVDFHAEATSEKVALGWFLDGRVCAVVGTHTHVPTADARVLPAQTAYITDVGMTGSRESVIGVKREQAIERFLTMMPVRFETATQDVWINAVLIEACVETGLAKSIEQILRRVDQLRAAQS